MNRASILALPLALALALSGCADPEGDFAEAQSADNIAAYNEFIQAHPDHELAARARIRVEELEEQAAWEDARQADTADAYEGFLNLHPDSPRAEEARQRALELRAASEWQALRGTEDMAALRDFVDRYQDTPEARQARQRLAELERPPEPAPEPEPPPEGDFQVQVAAFQSEAAAERERDRLMAAFPALLDDTALRVEPPAPGSRLYRVRTPGLDREEASSLCAELQGAGLDCYVAARD